MSQWKIPSIPKLEHDTPPPGWLPVAILIICIVVGFVLTVLDWKPGTPISKRFIATALLMPSLLGVAIGAACYLRYEAWRDKVDWWNFRVDHHFMNWRYWSQWNVPIIDSVVLTPEVDLAERMLGLEGAPPQNAGATKTLDIGTPSDPTRVAQIIEKLVTPLLEHLKRFDGTEAVDVILTAPSDAYLDHVMAVLEKLEMPHLNPDNLSHASSEQVPGLLDAFVNARAWQRQRPLAACLVISFQLHEEGREPTFSESASAILLTSMNVANKYKFKPKARLFRPSISEPGELNERVACLLTAAPSPLDKLRHAWMTALPKLARHNTMGTVRDLDRELTLLDVDQAIGLPGPANAWIVQALAAQMVSYGQGPQLVFAPDKRGVMFNVVGGPYSAVSVATPPEQNSFPVSSVLMIACTGGLLLTLSIAENLGSAWAFGILGVMALLLFAGLPLLSAVHYRRTDDEFDRAARR